MNSIKFLKSANEIHFYKVLSESNDILHISLNTSGEDKVVTKNGRYFTQTQIKENNSFLINNLKKDKFTYKDLIESNEIEFSEKLKSAILGLNI